MGHGGIEMYPGTYEEYLWSKAQREQQAATPAAGPKTPAPKTRSAPPAAPAPPPREAKRAADAEARRRQRASQQRAQRIAEIEARIAEKEQAIKDTETQMAAPGFYDDRDASKTVINRHQTLMWEVRDLMEQWEELQNITSL